MRRGALAVLFLLLGGLLLAVLPGKGPSTSGSVYSTEPGGLRALFLLLEELGFRAEPWTRSPGNLPRGSDLLVLAALPAEPPGYRPADQGAEPQPETRRLRDLRHYRRFVEEGGAILLGIDGDGAAALEFLRSPLGIELGDLAFEGGDAGEVGLELGEESLRLAHASALVGELPAGAEMLAARTDGAPVAVRIPAGLGSVVLAGPSLELLDNASIDEGDHALFLLRLLEALPPFERILFDEYALGGWAPDSPLALALAPGTIVFSLHLLALALLLLWRSAWAGPFARDPEPLASVSTLARAEGLAATIARAERWDLLARLLRTGLLERWAARAGARMPGTGTAAFPLGREGGLDPVAVESALAKVFGRDPAALARARAAFLELSVRREEDLRRLDADLRALERALLASPGAPRSDSVSARWTSS